MSKVSYLHRAMMAVKNNPSEILVEAAKMGDEEAVDMLMNYDRELSKKRNIITRHELHIPERYLIRAAKESFYNCYFNLCLEILDRSQKRIGMKSYKDMTKDIIRSVQTGLGLCPYRLEILEKLHNNMQELNKDSKDEDMFLTTLGRLLNSENPAVFAENFDKYLAWNTQKLGVLTQSKSDKRKASKANDIHLSERRAHIDKKARQNPDIKLVKK